MGQCGCGDLFLEKAYPVAGTENILGIERYPGCQDCGTNPQVVLHFFTPAGWEEWKEFGRVRQLEEPLEADDYGGQGGHGWSVPLAGVDEMIAAAEEDEDLDVDPAEYGTFGDLLRDHGTRLLRVALRRVEWK